jgi:hypothetical protein
MRRLLNIAQCIIAVSLFVSACERVDYFKETNSAKNVFAFSVGGNTVHNPSSKNHLGQPIWAELTEDNTLVIYSALEPLPYLSATIQVQASELEVGNPIENFTLQLRYEFVDVVDAAYMATATVLDKALTIRMLDLEKGVVSGNLEFTYKMQFLTRDQVYEVEQGNFDISLNQVQ